MNHLNVTFSVRNDNPDTIWNKLAKKLGRDPTEQKCREEFKRIIQSKDTTQ